MQRISSMPPNAAGRKINRRHFLAWTASTAILGGIRPISSAGSNAHKIAVLTFDDAVKSQRTTVAPLLKEIGFGATFFVCHRWMVSDPDLYTDPEQYMTWQEIAEIHQMGFEIGNHSWTHPSFSVPRAAARMPAELALVEFELQRVGVPRPISFAWCANVFCTEALQQLAERGYKLARRGMQPEVDYGKTEVGPTFDPQRHHPLLVPTTGDAYPGWTLDHFREVADHAQSGQIVIYQFHGVPDPHPWVSTPPERFREYMGYLKEQGFRVVALRDVEEHVPKISPADPLLTAPFLGPPNIEMALPVEMQATQTELGYWLMNMIHYHHYTWEEVERVTGLDTNTLKGRAQEMGIDQTPPLEPSDTKKKVRVLPYPGGRHPRIGFLEGALLPQRGTKASVFLPWDAASYVVIDLPEAIFSNLGLIFLAHTHIPTIWDDQNIWLDNLDWDRVPTGDLSVSRVLPNRISFGASVRPSFGRVEMTLWLRNDTSETVSDLRTQICVMLKGTPGFNSQTNDNKIFRSPVSAAMSDNRHRSVLVAWDRCGHAWGNPLVPCMHADPVLPNCAPGQTVRVRGSLWFFEGSDIEGEINRARKSFSAMPAKG